MRNPRQLSRLFSLAGVIAGSSLATTPRSRPAGLTMFRNSPTPATPAPSDVGAGGGETRIGKGKKPKTQPGTTPRKCAGCGASGHIKTNRK